MFDTSHEDETLVAESQFKATGANTHKVNQLLGHYRHCVMLAYEADTKEQADKWIEQAKIAEKELRQFLANI
jgi:hypothetical protein